MNAARALLRPALPIARLPRIRATLWARLTPWLHEDLVIAGGSLGAVFDALLVLPGDIGMTPVDRSHRHVLRAHLTRARREQPGRRICGEILVYLSAPLARPAHDYRPRLVHGVDEIDGWE
jgi:hypothetical protein